MDLPHFGEAELVCNWRQGLDNSEGSLSFQGELWIGNRSFEIPGF